MGPRGGRAPATRVRGANAGLALAEVLDMSTIARRLALLLVAALAGCPPMAPPVAPAPWANDPRLTATASADAAAITLNGRPISPRDREVLAGYERQWGVAIPAGHYWYDGVSGAVGQWGGPTRGFLSPGLGLGGPLPTNASGGGDGRLTGVFINGRELHPLDVAGLTRMLGQAPWPGRWWVDGQGNFGPEGGAAVGNLMAAARGRGGGGDSYYKSDVGTGSSTFVGSGCAAVSARTNPSSSDSSSYSYYVGCE